MSAAAILGIICESAASWACSTLFASCFMITMALRPMNISECHGDVTRWCCGDSWVIYVGVTLSRRLVFLGGDSRPTQQPSNESKGRIESRALHLSHGKAVSAMYPDTDHSTSASIRGKQAPGLPPLSLNNMRIICKQQLCAQATLWTNKH